MLTGTLATANAQANVAYATSQRGFIGLSPQVVAEEHIGIICNVLGVQPTCLLKHLTHDVSLRGSYNRTVYMKPCVFHPVLITLLFHDNVALMGGLINPDYNVLAHLPNFKQDFLSLNTDGSINSNDLAAIASWAGECNTARTTWDRRLFFTDTDRSVNFDDIVYTLNFTVSASSSFPTRMDQPSCLHWWIEDGLPAIWTPAATIRSTYLLNNISINRFFLPVNWQNIQGDTYSLFTPHGVIGFDAVLPVGLVNTHIDNVGMPGVIGGGLVARRERILTYLYGIGLMNIKTKIHPMRPFRTGNVITQLLSSADGIMPTESFERVNLKSERVNKRGLGTDLIRIHKAMSDVLGKINREAQPQVVSVPGIHSVDAPFIDRPPGFDSNFQGAQLNH